MQKKIMTVVKNKLSFLNYSNGIVKKQVYAFFFFLCRNYNEINSY